MYEKVYTDTQSSYEQYLNFGMDSSLLISYLNS
jgi:hypothetical protein